MLRRPFANVVLLALLVGCDSTIAPEPSAAVRLTGCSPGEAACAPPWTSVIGLPGGVPDYPSFAAASDPMPGFPGLWVGSLIRPTWCFKDLNPTGIQGFVDNDHDWLFDECEFVLASAFRPELMIRGDCEGAEPYWAARYFKDGSIRIVRILYMLAYYNDCGNARIPFGADPGHTGDGEWIMLDVSFDANRSRWTLEHLYMSSHGEIRQAPWYDDRVRKGFVSPTRGYPLIYVADGKHANYFNDTQCDHDFWESPLDHCNATTSGRVTVLPGRNVGDVFANDADDVALIGGGTGCVSSSAPHAGKQECFIKHHYFPFNGWYAGGSGGNYYSTLREIYRVRGSDQGPGPNPPPPVIYAGIYGPTQFPGNQTQSWTAQVSGPVTWPVSYQWLVDGSPAGNGSTLYRNFDPATAHIIYLSVTDAGGLSASTNLMVQTNFECGNPPCEEWLVVPGTRPSAGRPSGRVERRRPVLPRSRD